MAMFQEVKRVRAYETVVEQIEHSILEGQLKPGDRLPSERRLMDQFGISRPTLREALRVLQSMRLIESKPGDPRGPVVLPFSTAALEKSLTSLVRIDQISLVDLLQFRMLIEGASSRLAACLPDEQLVDRMEQAMRDMEQAIEDPEGGNEAFGRADLAFHEAKADAARNPLLRVCNEVVRDRVLKIVVDKIDRAPNSTAQMWETLQHHEQVLSAIRRGDGARAEDLSSRSIFEYYGHLVAPEERDRLRMLLAPSAPPLD